MGVRYNRAAAAAYAERYWNGKSPGFPRFARDSMNFISQALWAGGWPMHRADDDGRGWWMNRAGSAWSRSWAVVDSFHAMLAEGLDGPPAVPVRSPDVLAVGDIILYDWEGNGRWTHVAIVTAMGGDGSPLVSAHSDDVVRAHWTLRGSPRWLVRTAYSYWHLADDTLRLAIPGAGVGQVESLTGRLTAP
ncbi:MAG: amidase domain-containing protein [Bacillota bacterium]